MTPQQRYYRKNKERLLKESRDRYAQDIEQQHIRAKLYKQNNHNQIKCRRNERVRRKRLENPSFKLKENVSRSIRGALKKNGGSKGGLSFLKFVGYTVSELKAHLECQFESWMNWSNWGTFNHKLWNDNDRSTWTWQIDHIIPQSTFSFTSMIDDNFIKCWSLDNLRPLNAKQNFLNGIELLKGRKL